MCWIAMTDWGNFWLSDSAQRKEIIDGVKGTAIILKL